MIEPTWTARTLRIGALALAGVVLAGCSLVPPSWGGASQARKLDARETRALLSGKTVVARNLNNGRTSVSYYAPDGRVRQLRNGRERLGAWRVTKGGRVCLAMGSRKESCRAVKLGSDQVYRKYRVEKGVERPVIAYQSIVAGDQRTRLAAATGARQGPTAAAPRAGMAMPMSARERNAQLQRLLAQAGYAPGPVDGIWGERSRRALMRMQAERGLPVTGQPSDEVITALTARQAR